ncbi:GNAT family N-acetyltransferase [Sphingomonas baiyangensis]|uniref:GNAT family N-acetyltransferase n=1 Tax=Sphingomonas baiyangensis TaxID=2572576 RepID=A0A4U1L0C9_9SPHN|nr:GNAT family N-acetyltransferase [Sphingomonas baiyangensis]TKD50177.1 GNAT family N-acetyltransferase [Sphingomonas baiyangensis]
MFVRTRRLTLRPGWIEDAPALAAAIGDARVVRNLARAPWPYGVADAEAFLAHEMPRDEPSLLIVARDDGAAPIVGGIGVARDDCGALELGYWLTPAYWGRGYATEAAIALVASLRASFGTTALVSGHFVDNPASGRVLQRAGFTATGEVAPRWSAARGCAVDCVLYRWQAAVAPQAAFVPLAA